MILVLAWVEIPVLLLECINLFWRDVFQIFNPCEGNSGESCLWVARAGSQRPRGRGTLQPMPALAGAAQGWLTAFCFLFVLIKSISTLQAQTYTYTG